MTDKRNEEVVCKLTDALVQVNGYAYATGYLTQNIIQLIDKYVPKKDQTELRIAMLGEACNVFLGGKK